MNSALLLFAGFGTLALLAFLYPGWRQRRLLGRPLAATWLQLVAARQRLFVRLSPAEQQQLLDLIRLFLAEKQFHGCAGLAITEEVRVTIAAHACLLLLNRRTEVFPRLRHILVYPGAFVMRGEYMNEDGIVSEFNEERLGESWHYGKVILSWDDVDYAAQHPEDGENVVLHEFAHQLDSESGSEDGVPLLRHNDPQQWAAVMQREYAALCRAVEQGQESVLDPYGAESPVEFFAVATETFFELPDLLDEWHPQLFSELQRYYCVDPRGWLP